MSNSFDDIMNQLVKEMEDQIAKAEEPLEDTESNTPDTEPKAGPPDPPQGIDGDGEGPKSTTIAVVLDRFGGPVIEFENVVGLHEDKIYNCLRIVTGDRQSYAIPMHLYLYYIVAIPEFDD